VQDPLLPAGALRRRPVTLRIQYREFGDRLARQAFYQDLSYDIERFPSIVSFRTYRIEVTKADNNILRYRVLEGH